MDDPPIRKFTIFDAMLLVVATGIGLMPARHAGPNLVAHVSAINTARLLESGYIREITARPDRPLLNSTRSVIGRSAWPLVGGFPSWSWRRAVVDRGLMFSTLQQAALLAFPLLLTWTFAALFLGICRPRPAWGDLARQPGMVACMSASASLLVITRAESLGNLKVPVAVVSGIVGASWIILATSKNWTPARSWVDRFGRIVGVGWLLVGAFGLL